MRKIAFNDGWTCRHAGDSGKGKPVTIPHDAMLDEKRTQESLGGINIGWFEGFDYVYEKEFSVPQEYEDFRLVFEFEGVYRNAEVYLNGKRAGFRPYGYTNFYVEANEFLHFGMKKSDTGHCPQCRSAKQQMVFGSGDLSPGIVVHTAKEAHCCQWGKDFHSQNLSGSDRCKG